MLVASFVITIDCRLCGTSFSYWSEGGRKRRYCPTCRPEAIKLYGHQRYIRQRGPLQVPVVACATCGIEFQQGQHRGRPRQYCSALCRGRATRPPKGKTRFTCQECGASFEAVSNGQNKFCSPLCRRKTHWRSPGKHAHVCEWCSTSFRAHHADRRFCSHECADASRVVPGSEKTGNHRDRCAKFGVPYDPSVRRAQVLERDNWLCWLCGEEIPQDVPYPDGRYGSIDHVIPLAKGGAHAWGNVRAAHLFCNCSRGAKDGPTAEAA